MPSRFVNDLPQKHTDNVADEGFYGNYGSFRDNTGPSLNPGSTYDSPGWRRVQQARASMGEMRGGGGRGPVINATARVVPTDTGTSQFNLGERVFHQKFGYGRIVAVEGNKLLVDFEKAGSKRVMDGFVSRT
jgi:DNA helicase II / ATP-dependent DNA helicase PcrA